VEQIGRKDVISAEGTECRRRGGREFHLGAELVSARPHDTHIVETNLAIVAPTTAHPWLESDLVPDLEAESGAHFGSHLDNGPARLVSETHGALEHKRADTGVVEVVNI
jgi:hypothetical protein